MKKISLFLFAATAMIFAASCNKGIDLGNDSKAELTINSVALTKGYVEAAAFAETPYDKLHEDPAADKVDRKMWLSAYMTPQSGASENYFVGQEFSKNANGETDNLWHHNPKVYWPLGGTLDFLAYSAHEAISGTALNWDPVNAASKLVLNVSNEFLQDDLIYGAVVGRKSFIEASGSDPKVPGASVAMTFNHTQAWIQFQIKVKEAAMENIFTLRDITINKLYTRGELTINGGATPNHVWNFKNETAVDYKMHDTYEICGDGSTAKYIKSTVGYMDMLVPAQDQTAFVMHYTLAGQEDKVLEYKYSLATAQWQSGKKYIYEITLDPYEITVTPTVTDFAVVNPGASGFPSELE